MTHRPQISSSASASDNGRSLDRRRFLQFVGFGAVSLACGKSELPLQPVKGVELPWFEANGTPKWTAPAYPVPLPTDPDGEKSEADRVRLASYEVIDDLVLPEGFRYDIVAQWGDAFGSAEHRVDFGYNNDYTGLIQIGDTDEYWLFVNHEYVSARPWLQALKDVRGVELPIFRLDPHEDLEDGQLFIDGEVYEEGNYLDPRPGKTSKAVPEALQAQIRQTCEEGLREQGVSVLRVQRRADGTFQVKETATDHKRIHGFGNENIADAVVEAFHFTGPAAAIIGAPPRGTYSNCSGGNTPWGTFLTCEENFHHQSHEEVTPDGGLQPGREWWFGGENEFVNGEMETRLDIPSSINGLGLGLEDPLDGRQYGWVVEVDPATGALVKHTHLGRFRHENVAVHAVAGKRLAAYMGDDRRGGHVWKFVSDGKVQDPKSPETRRLLEKGTLYVAQFDPRPEDPEADGIGRWIPLVPETSLSMPQPEEGYSKHLTLPDRRPGDDGVVEGGHVRVGSGKKAKQTLDDWRSAIEAFTGKSYDTCTLADLVQAPEGLDDAAAQAHRQGVLLLDAFVMANVCGGTPTARPEDLEVHPVDGSVYIAFTDATDGGDGSPDGRVFVDSNRESSRQYGAIFRLVEDGDDPAATSFKWGQFVSSGEVAEQGGGFACADNLVFDPGGNLWMVTDISTTKQNFPNQRDEATGTQPGGKQFPGVFGNNALFMIPTKGPEKGVPRLFAIGPVECEICGPTFTEDGRTLILSIQHPGELAGFRAQDGGEELVTHIVHDRADQPFEQQRKTPIGSNFPHGERGRPPQPAVVCVTLDGSKTA